MRPVHFAALALAVFAVAALIRATASYAPDRPSAGRRAAHEPLAPRTASGEPRDGLDTADVLRDGPPGDTPVDGAALARALDLLRDGAAELRLAALDLLAASDDPAAGAAVLAALAADPDERVRAEAPASAYSHFARRDDGARAAASDALRTALAGDPAPSVRAAAAHALTVLGPADDALAEALANRLPQEAHREVRGAIALALGCCEGETARRETWKLAADPREHPDVRIEAVRSLDEAAELRALAEREPEERVRAALRARIAQLLDEGDE